MAVLLSKVLGCPKPRNVHCTCDINMFVAIPTNDKDWLTFGEGLNFKSFFQSEGKIGNDCQ